MAYVAESALSWVCFAGYPHHFWHLCLSAYGHLGRFCILTVANGATVNMGAHIPLPCTDASSLGYIPVVFIPTAGVTVGIPFLI